MKKNLLLNSNIIFLINSSFGLFQFINPQDPFRMTHSRLDHMLSSCCHRAMNYDTIFDRQQEDGILPELNAVILKGSCGLIAKSFSDFYKKLNAK